VDDPLLEEIFRLSDALLAAVRPANPDFDLIRKMVERRGEILARLPAPRAEERQQRVVLIQQILAKDAVLRTYLETRQKQVLDELGVLARRGPLPRQAPARPSLFDQRI
jgi:hypothetical protein